MAETYLDMDTTTGRFKRKSASSVSTGSSDAGKIVALGSDGKIDASMISSTSGGGGDSITATEALTEGDVVNLYNSSGRKARKALATDETKPGHAFVLASVAQNAAATVFATGTNTKVSLTGFTTADIGKPVYLSASTAGGLTKTPPSSGGNLVQRVGFVKDVTGSYVEVEVDFGYEIVV